MTINSARKFYWILPVAAFAFSAGSLPKKDLKKDLWNILERHTTEEALQVHLAIIVVSEGESVDRRAQAVSKLLESGAETLVEEVQMALMDVVRLQDTPQKVKRAISRTFKPSIIDEKNQMSILDYALSEKAQRAGRAAEITVSAAIEGFRYLSTGALLKTMELAVHPQAPKKFCRSAMRTVKREFSQFPKNREIQMAIVDLVLSDQASQKLLGRGRSETVDLVLSDQASQKGEKMIQLLLESGAETLVEEVQMALMDAVRLQDTPQEVKRAISRTFKPSISDEKNQMSILDYALSEKAQGAGRAAEITVSAAIEGFRYLSTGALLKTMELAAHPQAPKNFCLSAMRTVKREFSKSPENREMQMAIVDLALSNQASQKGEGMIQLLSGAIDNFQNSSPAVLLKLAELAASPKEVHWPFREPALYALERSAASIDSETQKKLLAALMSQDITDEMAQKTIGIFHKIPKIDPEAENLLVKAVFFNQKSPIVFGKKRRSRKKSPDFYRNTAIALSVLLPPAAGLGFFYGIADGEVSGFSILGSMAVGSFVSYLLVGSWVFSTPTKQKCRAAFKKDPGY